MPGHVKPQNLPGHELSRLARFRLQVEAQLTNLGRAIERERKAKGWSRARLAREIPVDPKTVERWEKGTSGGAMESLGNIAKALGVELDQLLAAQLEISREETAPATPTEESGAAEIDQVLLRVAAMENQLLAELALVKAAQAEQRSLLETVLRNQESSG